MTRWIAGVALAVVACGGSEKTTGPTASDAAGVWRGSYQYGTVTVTLADSSVAPYVTGTGAVTAAGTTDDGGRVTFGSLEDGQLLVTFASQRGSGYAVACAMIDARTCNGTLRIGAAPPYDVRMTR